MLRNNRNTPNWSKLYFRFNSKNALLYFCLLTKIGFWYLHKICLNFKMNKKSLQSNACTSSYSWNTRLPNFSSLNLIGFHPLNILHFMFTWNQCKSSRIIQISSHFTPIDDWIIKICKIWSLNHLNS